MIDVGSERWAFYGERGGDDKSRVGATEISLLGSDLSTMIGPSPEGSWWKLFKQVIR